MPLETIAAFVLLLALTVYVLTGGADFGAGFWLLAARGKEREQKLLTAAISPIWEANHVWLVMIIVLVAGGFPRAVAAISTALCIPLMFMLIGVTLRGAAFAFSHYGPQNHRFQKTWVTVFSSSSVLTPFFLGTCMGAAVSGTIRVPQDGIVRTDFVSDWLAPFPIVVGLYTLAIGVYLAAIYLAAGSSDPVVAESFRKRAVFASVALGFIAFSLLLVSRGEAPTVFERLTAHSWSWPFHVVTALLSLATLVLLLRGSIHGARLAAIGQVLAIMFGLGLAQYPFIVAPDVTIYNSAAPHSSMLALLTITAIGLFLVTPAFGYLYWVFEFQKRRNGGEAPNGIAPPAEREKMS